jgi:hypothetical protein
VTANPVSTPAPLSDTAAKIGIFANPTYPEPPVVSTPTTVAPATYPRAVAFTQTEAPTTYYQPTPVEPDNTGYQGQGTITAGEDGNLGGDIADGGGGGEEEQTAAFNAEQLAHQNEDYSEPLRVDVSGVYDRDWRVKLQLATYANYLYKDPKDPGILAPLAETDGVIFPYTPTISTNYSANYDGIDITHSNYKIYQYKNSSVGEIQIQADFTAQDTKEANYLLAVIHFFRSATKMFYGNDQNPPNGTPPPVLYLSGFGRYQFSKHPVVIQSFSYRLPADVDYIKSGELELDRGISSPGSPPPPPTGDQNVFQKAKSFLSNVLRLNNAGLKPGGAISNPEFKTNTITTPTYVPTKISISLTLLPIVSRRDVSQNFSLKDYGSGKLIDGGSSARGSSSNFEKGMW